MTTTATTTKNQTLSTLVPYDYPLDDVGSRTVSVDVSPEVRDYLERSRKKINRVNKYYQRHTLPLDNATYEGSDYGKCDRYFVPTVAELCAADEEFDRRVKEAWGTLTEAQQRRTKLYRENGFNLTEVAKIEGVSVQSVSESIDAAFKKFKKFFG